MKKLLIGLLSLLALLVVGLIALLAIFDPNDYKPQITQAVEESTGRQLTIQGDIGWQLFPDFALTLSEVSLANPKGFDVPEMVSLKKLAVSVAVMPLFSGKLEVDGLSLETLKLNLITLADGQNNLDDLTGPKKSEELQPTPQAEPQKQADLSNIALGRIEIKDIQLVVDNRQTDARQELLLELFELSQLVPGQQSDARIQLKLNAADMEMDVNVQASMTISERFDHIKLHGLKVKTDIQGEALPKGELSKTLEAKGEIQLNPLQVELSEIQLEVASLKGSGWFKFKQQQLPDLSFALNFGTLDLADFLPPPAKEEEQAKEQPVAATEPSAAADPTAEPDLTGLNGLKVTGELGIEKILAQGLVIENMQLAMLLENGVFKAKPLKAKLYDGGIQVNATLNGQKKVASYAADVALSKVNLLPLLKDAAELELLAGVANFKMEIQGTGLSQNKLKTASVAKGNFLISDGAVYGINIAQKIRALKGESGEETRKTDFSSLSGSFTLKEGVANNPDLQLASPLLRVTGEGTFDVVKTYVNYLAAAELVATSKGQGGKSGDELAGLRIPLRIKGTPDNLSYKLDLKSALKEETKRKADEKKEELKDKAKEKLKNKLKGFFG